MPLQRFMEDYPWIMGVILIIAGLFVGIFGKRFFAKVLACVIFLVSFGSGLILCSIFGWMNTMTGFCVCLGVMCLVAGLLAWVLTRTWALGVMFFVLGGFAGFFLGLMVYSALLTIVGSGPAWAMLASGIVFAIIGAFVAYKNAAAIVILSTALIGSYWFMRGLSDFIGGYPNEGAIFVALMNDLSL